jgi:outer membrane protein assembly factor BamB
VLLAGLVSGWPSVPVADNGLLYTDAAAVENAVHKRLEWLQRPEAWQLRWSQPIQGTAPAVAAGIVAWIDAGAVRGVRAVDGLPAWRSVPPGDTLLFPRSVLQRREAARLVDPGLSGISVVGHLLYGVIDAGRLGPLMICLDCSDTAEGRLLWSASPPPGLVGFDGPPVADDRLCVVVVRGSDGRSPLEIVAHDARDGVIIWRRPLSTGVARDGINHAPGRRQASLVEDLVVVADHAGSVWAFDRDGQPMWRYEYEVIPRGDDRLHDGDGWPAAAEPVVASARCIMVAAQDRGGVIALDPAARSAQLRWEAAVGECVRIIGVANDRVVIEQGGVGREGPLVTRDVVSGHAVASSLAEPLPAGPAVLAGGVILQPVVEKQGGRQRPAIVALDPSSLRALGPPFPLPEPGSGAQLVEPAGAHAVYLAAMPAAIVVATSSQLFSIGPSP